MRSDPRLDLENSDLINVVFPIEQNVGVSHSGHERNHLFLNLDGSRYLDVSTVSGLDDVSDGRAFALWDFDGDGWQDIAAVNANTPKLRLYRNRIGDRPGSAERGRTVALRFHGGHRGAEPAEGLACRDGYGAQVRLELAGRTLLREYRCGEGLAAQNSRTMLVGIGSAPEVRRLHVRWPSGRTQSIDGVAAGSLVEVWEVPEQSPSGAAFVVRPYGRPSPPRLAGAPRPEPLARLNLRGRTGGGDPELTVFTTMATWCPTCKGELPQIAKLRRAFDERQIALVALPLDPGDTPEKLRGYVDAYDPAYTLVTDLSAGDKQAVSSIVDHLLNIENAFPATLITDHDGMVLYAGVGVPSISDVRRLLEANGR